MVAGGALPVSFHEYEERLDARGGGSRRAGLTSKTRRGVYTPVRVLGWMDQSNILICALGCNVCFLALVSRCSLSTLFIGFTLHVSAHVNSYQHARRVLYSILDKRCAKKLFRTSAWVSHPSPMHSLLIVSS